MSGMFCFQCEQAAGGTGCSGSGHGTCGKSAEASRLQDLLLRLAERLARQMVDRSSSSESFDRMILNALLATMTNVDFDPDHLEALCRRMGSACSRPLPASREDLLEMAERCGVESERRNTGCEMANRLSFLLFAIKGAAAYYHHAVELGYCDPEISRYFRHALAYLVHPDLKPSEMINLSLECGRNTLKILALLDKAHNEVFGSPEPTEVAVTPTAGKAILVTGHDLRLLREVLIATEGAGINVYTHGELLPAHSYPKLRAFPHLVGNYGGSWHEQQTEFAAFPGPVLVTTNCMMPPRDEYHERLFTAGAVRYPDVSHLEAGEYGALACVASSEPGFPLTVTPPRKILVGFGHHALEAILPRIVELMRDGQIRRLFLIGGCDGAKTVRDYYTTLAEIIPQDCLILTLACGKFRFNRQEFGTIDGIPRLLDLGQCSDAHTAIVAIRRLAELMHTDVNSLPLSIILSWYEQKAVSILLALFSLGVRNIKLGPGMPAFFSEDMKALLAQGYRLRPITTPEADLAEALSNSPL